MTLAQDKTKEEVGATVCLFHEYIQTFPKDWEHKLKVATSNFQFWLHHPLRRNWSLIEKLEGLMDENKQLQG